MLFRSRRGELIDRHNLWDLVGAGYKRTLYPGVTDSVAVQFQCPSMARGRVSQAGERRLPGGRVEAFAVPTPTDAAGTLHVSAVLWYRKANPEFLAKVYDFEPVTQAPVVEIVTASHTIEVVGAR